MAASDLKHMLKIHCLVLYVLDSINFIIRRKLFVFIRSEEQATIVAALMMFKARLKHGAHTVKAYVMFMPNFIA